MLNSSGARHFLQSKQISSIRFVTYS